MSVNQQNEAFPVKLTKWAKEPTLIDLKNDFEMAKHAQIDQMTKIRHWNNLMEVKGSAKPRRVQGRSQIQPKLVRRQAEWRYAPLSEPFTGSDKLFEVKPRTFEDTKAARQNETLLNWQFSTKINKVQFVDNYVRANVDEGTCIVRVGWTRHTVKITQQVPVYTHTTMTSEDEVMQLQQALELRGANPKEYNETVPPEIQEAVNFYDETGQATVATQTGTQPHETEKVIENKPEVEVLNPQNVYIDPSCGGDIDKAMFVIFTFETYQAELRKQPGRYKNLDKVEWGNNAPVMEPDHETRTPQAFAFRDEARRKVVAHEYWGFYDIEGNNQLTPFVATWIGNCMIRMELNPFPDGKLPFVLVPYMPVKRELFGEPDAELLGDNQAIMGALTRGMIDLLGRSANGQTGYAKGMLDALNRRKMENGNDYEFNPNIHPSNGMLEHKYPEIPQSALQLLGIQNQEAEALTGVKSFSGGLSGDAYGDVAAGIRGVLDAASKREMAILRRLAKGMVDIANKIIAMNSVFLSEEEVVRVTNEEYVTIRREDLKGNFDLKCDISTAEIDDAQAKELAFMLQTIGNTLDPSFTVMILAEIARLKKMVALEKKLSDWKPPVDEKAEKLKDLAIEKAGLENEELRSKIRLNDAKAREAEAKADLANLDFVETETGTKHARDMDKQQAQAQGNKELQITKALTSPRKEGEKDPDLEAAMGYNEVSGGTAGITANIPQPTVDFAV